MQEGLGATRSIAESLHLLLAKHDIDVVALQEVPFERRGFSSWLRALQVSSEWQFAATRTLSERHYSDVGFSGLATLSRVRLREESFTPFKVEDTGSVEKVFDKGVQTCILENEQHQVSKDHVSISNVHMFPFDRFGLSAHDPEFSNEWQTLIERITIESGPALLCGDFNTEDRRLLIEHYDSIESALKGTPTHEGKAFDDILFTRRWLTLEDAQCVVTNSDHDFCFAKFQVQDEQID